MEDHIAKHDIYTGITEKIIADLQAGTRPWHKPCNANLLTGRITLPLRHNGIAYRGLNIIVLWSDSVAQGYVTPIKRIYR